MIDYNAVFEVNDCFEGIVMKIIADGKVIYCEKVTDKVLNAVDVYKERGIMLWKEIREEKGLDYCNVCLGSSEPSESDTTRTEIGSLGFFLCEPCRKELIKRLSDIN